VAGISNRVVYPRLSAKGATNWSLVLAPEEQHVYSLAPLDNGSLRQERHAKRVSTLHSYGAPVCQLAKSYKHAAPPEQSR